MHHRFKNQNAKCQNSKNCSGQMLKLKLLDLTNEDVLPVTGCKKDKVNRIPFATPKPWICLMAGGPQRS